MAHFDCKISNNHISLISSNNRSTNSASKIDLHSKTEHIFFSVIQFLFPCWSFTQKINLNGSSNPIFINLKSYQKWRQGKDVLEWVKTLSSNPFNEKNISKQIRAVLAHFPKHQLYRNPQFNHPIAKQLGEFLINNEQLDFEKYLKRIPKKDLQEALLCKDNNKQTNILALTAHYDNFKAVDQIASLLPSDQLKQILLQTDKTGWTALHHLGLMSDSGFLYKALKKKANIDTKKVGEFYCESPSMLRKYIRSNPKRFSTATEANKIFFRDGPPQMRTETTLTYSELMKKHGSKFSEKPKHFKFIPHVKRDTMRSLWAQRKEVKRDRADLKKIDLHLHKIYKLGYEEGVALCTVKHSDNGKKLPDNLDLGVGAEARQAFKEDDLVTLYGGRYYPVETPDRKPNSYTYHSSQDEIMDGALYRAYGSSLLHSAPNTEFYTISSSLITFLSYRALEDISAKSQLCVSYGRNYFLCKGYSPLETRPEARKRMETNLSKDPHVANIQKHYLAIKAQVPG